MDIKESIKRFKKWIINKIKRWVATDFLDGATVFCCGFITFGVIAVVASHFTYNPYAEMERLTQENRVLIEQRDKAEERAYKAEKFAEDLLCKDIENCLIGE